MADTLDRLLQFWRKRNVEPATERAAPAEIEAWEAKYGVVMPDDLREYVSRVNGIKHGEHLDWDHDLTSFLPLSAMVPDGEWGASTGGTNLFVFADYMIQSYWWRAEITNKQQERTPIFLSGIERPRLVAASLQQFLQTYMDGAKGLHP